MHWGRMWYPLSGRRNAEKNNLTTIFSNKKTLLNLSPTGRTLEESHELSDSSNRVRIVGWGYQHPVIHKDEEGLTKINDSGC